MIRVGVPPLTYNYKHVHMYVILLTKKVIYDNVISHAHRHAGMYITVVLCSAAQFGTYSDKSRPAYKQLIK